MATERQKEVVGLVLSAWRAGHRWYRAKRSGERVTLASLYHAGVLERRVWRGVRPYEAHEYRPSNTLLTELARESGESPVADMIPVDEKVNAYARAKGG